MMKELFFKLLWPAAAGNVAWSFFSLFVDKGWSAAGEVQPRLIVLALLAWYLGDEWWRNEKRNSVYRLYWVADAALLASIIAFALATQGGGGVQLERFLKLILWITIIGHVSGAWLEKRVSDKQKFSLAEWSVCWRSTLWARIALAVANALGLLVLWLSHYVLPAPTVWTLAAAIAVVLGAWYLVTLMINPRLAKSGDQARKEGADATTAGA